MENFIYNIPTQIAFGKGEIIRLPEYIKEYGNKVLFVYGGGSVIKTGLYDIIVNLMKKNGISYCELSGVEPNPRLSTVRRGVHICRENSVQVVVPAGGGSVIDCAKVIAAAALSEYDPWDLIEDSDKITDVLPIIAVPTMAATGSEMDPYAVITNEDIKRKQDIYNEKYYPRYSILDPEYTYSVSKYQTASGIADIMSHIFEVYFANVNGTYFQDRLMEGMLRTLIHYGPIACQEPNNYEARANIMWTSEWAINGLISCGKPGPWPAHSIEHQLSAYYDITHGHGLAIVTPVLMEYLLERNETDKLVEYGVNVWNLSEEKEDKEIAKEAILKTRELYEKMGLCLTLEGLGVPYEKEDLEKMAETAVTEGLDECLVPLSEEDVVNIYERCFCNC